MVGSSGDKLILEWTVSNYGIEETTANTWFDQVYLSTDETFDESDYLLTSTQISQNLEPDGTYTQMAEITIPEEAIGDRILEPGTALRQNLIFITDAGESQWEISGINNTLSIPLIII